MDKNQFDALLPMIVAAFVKKITEREKISHDEAITRLYGSSLYSALENEPTKVWHYSVEKLFQLFEQEMNTGELELPEY